MRLRVTFASQAEPHGALMLRHGADGRKVDDWIRETRTPRDNLMIDLDQTRSDPDHAHYFACIKLAWDNLPEDMHNDFLSPEHLRKWALVKSGWCTKSITVAKSKAEARRLAAALQDYDKFVVTVVDKRVVTAHRAVSQAYDEMGKRDFQKSKQAVLEVLSKLIGTSVDELLRSVPHGRQAEHHRTDAGDRLHDGSDGEIPRGPDQRSADENR